MMRFLIAVTALVLWTNTSWADVETDCRQNRNFAVRLHACTKLIDDPSTSSAQKALAYRNRGRIRVDAGAHQEALTDLNAAIRLKPDDALAFANRAHVRLALGEHKSAVVDLTKAIRIKPRSQDFIVARGYAQIVSKNFDAAIADLNLALVLNPDNPVALNNRGLAYRKNGNIDRAIKDYSAAISRNPIYAIAYANRAYALEASGQKQKAIADFKRAVNIDPTLTGAKIGLTRLGENPQVFDVKKTVKHGKKLAEKNCAWCHAIKKTGVSPNPKAPPFRVMQQRHPLRALREPITRGIATPHDVMPNYELSASDIDKIVAYVHSLASQP